MELAPVIDIKIPTVHDAKPVEADGVRDSPLGTTTPQRLLVVSNRLPVTITSTPEGSWKYKMSSGGLVSALEGVRSKSPQLRDQMLWIGWPGADFSPAEQAIVRGALMVEYNCLPIFIPDAIADLHYNGFSNSILWPLFHYYPGEIHFNQDYWDAYTQANQQFADSIADILQDGDLVWVHDYHLMLLPEMLRKRISERTARGDKLDNVKIGFFLHIPFPSSEVYRILPVRKQVLQGVLSADLVGFHTYDYVRHFLSSCTRILTVSAMPNGVEVDGRFVEVAAVPIGIDTHKFVEALENEAIKNRISQLESKFEGMKVVVGVDRLDYIKGVPQKLHAIELLLERHPEYVGKLVLVQVAVPSRQDVQEYQNLRHIVNELVGRINGRFGSVDYMPIHFMHKSVTFDELVALYSIADTCLISSTRDGEWTSPSRFERTPVYSPPYRYLQGMNLVSYEYIASQRDKHGVLVLSEFAGAAQSLNGSIKINPWNTDEIANALYEALTMTPELRKQNHDKLYRYVSKFTASFWGETFVSDQSTVISKFTSSAGKKVLFLDYDGTLTKTQNLPEDAQPTDRVHSLLRSLNDIPDVYVYVLSGRDRPNLVRWFGDTGVGLSAEHGCFVRHPCKFIEEEEDAMTIGLHESEDDESEVDDSNPEGPDALSVSSGTRSVPSNSNSTAVGNGRMHLHGRSPSGSSHLGSPSGTMFSTANDRKSQFVRRDPDGWLSHVDKVDSSWRDVLRPLFQHYTERTPNSFIEEKEVNITWHYRNADPEFGSWQAAELQLNLEKLLARMPVSVILGDKTLELRPSLVDKALAAKTILKDIGITDVGFVLCVGDGKADESLFTYLRDLPTAFTATVGKKSTEARSYLESPEHLVGLLEKLVLAREEEMGRYYPAHSLSRANTDEASNGGHRQELFST
ncbi:Trehalose-6-P synthase/phosphatase complex synthase subunit [Gonapodya sp. JEL0774]|nr:Trehalose-6-P synthase/phosphatase complex synthase subunit [Gonapodya sp. JEL0774]